MTWNVHGTFHLNPDFDLEGVSSIIEKWSPDVVALQEVDLRGRTDDPFGELADGGGPAPGGSTIDRHQDGDYGQVLLSRFPFTGPADDNRRLLSGAGARRAITARNPRRPSARSPSSRRIWASRSTSATRRLVRSPSWSITPHNRCRRFQRLVLGKNRQARIGRPLSGPDPIADISVTIADPPARPHLRHARRRHIEGVDRQGGEGLLGPFAGPGRHRVFLSELRPRRHRSARDRLPAFPAIQRRLTRLTPCFLICSNVGAR